MSIMACFISGLYLESFCSLRVRFGEQGEDSAVVLLPGLR